MASYLSLSQNYSLLVPPNPAFSPKSPRGGILLNAARPRHAATYPPITNNYYLSAQSPPSPIASGSSSDVSTDLDGAGTSPNSASAGSRKIRFAPLPDPRRPPTPDEVLLEETASPAVTLTGTTDDADRSSLDGSLTHSDDMDNSTISGISSRDSAGTPGASSSKRSWGKKLLRPFIGSSRSPTRGEDGGSLGLFRTASRDSASDVSPPNGLADGDAQKRGRRRSTGTAPSPLRRALDLSPLRSSTATSGVPLSQTVSDSGPSRRIPGRVGKQRMLNGRVYGSRSMEGGSTTYTEPEFVEWGYGGMGSNSNSSTARSTDYSKLQSGNKVTVGAAARSSVRDDDDDGSGMTWLKKRREMRAEKERLEKEAREAAAALAGDEAAVIVESPSSSSSSSSSNEEPISHTQGASTPTAASSLTPHTSRPASPSRPEVPRTQSAIDRHRCSAVNIPAPVSHYSHHHHHHPHHVPTIAEGEADAMVVPPIKKRADSVSSASSEADASSSNNEREDDDEEGDSESDDEDQEEIEKRRKQALGAGVEKISRHH